MKALWLGLVDAKIWTRPEEPVPNRRRTPFANKDSARWLWGVERVAQCLHEARELVVVGDRESDIYALFARCPQVVRLVVRARHNRHLPAGGRLFEQRNLREWGQMDVFIAARPGQKARTARVVLRSGMVRLGRPPESMERQDPAELEVYYVETVEPNPPRRAQAVCWRLLTTLPVKTEADARQVVEIYRLRWRIEEVFRALKRGGLDLEATQVEEAQRLFKLSALAIVAAVRIVQLVDARDGSSRPASDVADPALFEAFEEAAGSLRARRNARKIRIQRAVMHGCHGLWPALAAGTAITSPQALKPWPQAGNNSPPSPQVSSLPRP